jgi:hypothetical protein
MTKAPARLKDISVSTRDSFMIDPRTIVIVDGFNARDYTTPENQEHIRSLADSIKEVGVKNPVTVRYVDGTAVLVDGECRVRATLLAISEGTDIAAIKAMAEDKGVSEADRKLSIFTMNMGKPLTMLEQGVLFAQLIGFGWSEAQIAKRSGAKPHVVANALELNAAPEALKTMVRLGQVAPTLTLEELRRGGEVATVEMLTAAAVVAGELGATRVMPKHVKAVRDERERSADVSAAIPPSTSHEDNSDEDRDGADGDSAAILAPEPKHDRRVVSPVSPPKPTKVERIVTRETARALVQAMIAIFEQASDPAIREIAETALAAAGVSAADISATA